MTSNTTDTKTREYFTADGSLRHELFDEEAQKEARIWVDSNIKTTQVRRFFGQAQADRRQIELAGAKATDEQARVAMAFLKASTAYGAARDKHRKPLADFAHRHAGIVRTVQDFKGFLRHFEAVVAWHRVFEKEFEDSRRGNPSRQDNRG